MSFFFFFFCRNESIVFLYLFVRSIFCALICHRYFNIISVFIFNILKPSCVYIAINFCQSWLPGFLLYLPINITFNLHVSPVFSIIALLKVWNIDIKLIKCSKIRLYHGLLQIKFLVSYNEKYWGASFPM